MMRYTKSQVELIGKNAAIVLNFIHDQKATSTRQIAGETCLSEKTVTAALQNLRVGKLLHPKALCLLPFAEERGKIPTERGKITTPEEMAAIPRASYNFGLLPPEIKKGDKERGDYRGDRIKGIDVEVISSTTSTAIGVKEVIQIGDLEKPKKKPTLQKIPTLDEVSEYFQSKQQTTKQAKRMFDYYEKIRKDTGGRVWKDVRGSTVKSWKHKAAAVWFEEKKQDNGSKYDDYRTV